MAFDTLDYARKLEAAGVPAAQAEVQARALNEALLGSVATKLDIANLERRIDARFAQVDARFEQVDARFGQIDERFKQVDARFDQVDARFVDLESRLSTRIETVKTELKLHLGGRMQTLGWMLGVLVAMNATIMPGYSWSASGFLSSLGVTASGASMTPPPRHRSPSYSTRY